ncbi:hypothetical protein JNUCC64_32240 [Streptomyces sp. JNUCC 64]
MVTGVCALCLLRAALSGVWGPRRWFVLLPPAGAGLVLAWGHRVLTAGTVDAGIRAGLAVFFGAPAVAGLSFWALAQAVRFRGGCGTGRTEPVRR